MASDLSSFLAGTSIGYTGSSGAQGPIGFTGSVGTGTISNPTFSGVISSTATIDMTVSQAADSLGTRGVPQNIQSTAYVLVAADAGKHILHPASDNNPRTFTIPANTVTSYSIGTVVTFINQINTLTVAIQAVDTMTLAASSSTGNRTLSVNGIATAIKTTATGWLISGTGLT